MILTVRHSATRFIRDSLQKSGVEMNFGHGIEHLHLMERVEPDDIIVMRDPDKTLLSNFRDPWRSWDRTLHMLWQSLEPLYGSNPQRFRVDKDDWGVLEALMGQKIEKGDKSWSSGVRSGAPSDGWDWVEEYAKFYFEDVEKWPSHQ